MFIVVVGVLIAILLWYKVVERMGFAGISLWFITLGIFIPIANLLVWVYLIFSQWPIHQENRRLREYIAAKLPMASDIDIEIERMRDEMKKDKRKDKKKY